MKIERDIKIIEAILFASNEPVSEDDLREKITNKNNFNEYLINIPLLKENIKIMIIYYFLRVVFLRDDFLLVDFLRDDFLLDLLPPVCY